MGSKANSQQAPVHWLREITKAQLIPFSFPGEKGNLDKFGQVWASQDKLGQGNNLEKWGKRQKE